ncbi:hypothetical protein Q1695_008282 [Nippostrongylus brasiliensis]|nr:hypothetical protein Q1695_008282 [Nippostrongylus brasiliensis]
MLLLLLSLIILQATEAQQAAPTSGDIVGVINQLRTAIATAQDAQNNNAALYLPQSDQMFKLVVYYKSTLAGCAVAPLPCGTTGKTNGFACVFNNQPQIGEPLYPVAANAMAGIGCVSSPSTCPAVDGKPSTCNANLCETAADTTFPR